MEDRKDTPPDIVPLDPFDTGTPRVVQGRTIPAGLVTRLELARHLGVSRTEIMRRESLGRLIPVDVTREGWKLYRLSDFEGAKEKPRSAGLTYTERQRGEYTAAQAKAVFEDLRDGTPLRDIVVKHTLHPAAVMAIADSWAAFDGGMFVPGPILARINQLPLEGAFPLAGPESLLAVLQAASIERACEDCKNKPRAVCRGCGRRSK